MITHAPATLSPARTTPTLGVVQRGPTASAKSPLSDAMLEVSSTPTAKAPGHTAAATKPLSSSARLRMTASFARQMQVLVGTGIPLAQALHACRRQARNPATRALLSRMASAVDEGRPLSHAMSDSAGAFDAISISLVAAGESSGNMAAMLERLAELKRRQLKLRSTLTGALAYPILLMTMGVGVLATMLLFVLPRFETLFQSLDSPLPFTTQLLMQASIVLRDFWWAVAIGAALVAGGIYYLFASGLCRAAFDRYYLRLPMIGPLGRSLLSARIARMLGTLLEAKVPLTEALDLTRRAAVNDAYADLISRAEQAVSRGQTLSSILDDETDLDDDVRTANASKPDSLRSQLLVPGVREAIRNGEASGRLGQPLCQIAEFLDEENDVALKALTSIIEPAILIVLGLVVGLIAMSIFLPMFDMITAAQGGAGGG